MIGAPIPADFRRRGRRRVDVNLDDDPVSLLVNFFDISIVFALGFMLLALGRSPLAGATDASPAESAPEESKVRLDHYRPTEETLRGQGERLGTAYRLANGEVVYVPDAPPAPVNTPRPAARP